MESELPIFRPNISEFTNFSRFISDLEQQNISFAKASTIYTVFLLFWFIESKIKNLVFSDYSTGTMVRAVKTDRQRIRSI